jgi:hypothetical protein
MTLPENRSDINEIKKEMSTALLKIGAITFFIGVMDILAGFFLKYRLNASPLISILSMLISLPIIVTINWIFIRQTLKK